MRIPVFVSCPSTLSSTQERSRALILEELAAFGLEPRAIGRSDYPIDFPLREVAILCRHCSGGVILGFEQFCADSGAWKKDTPEAKVVKGSVSFPSPWNNMEGAILFALGLPILVFREPCISGGIFDIGATDAFIHGMPRPDCAPEERESLRAVVNRWQARVQINYYQSWRLASNSGT